MARQVTRDTELGGAAIAAGETVLVLPGPVNRDGSVFAEPGSVRPARPGGRAPVGFGYGIHYCVGAPLARLELSIALSTLLERYPQMRLWPVQPVAFARAPLITQIARMLVEPGPGRDA
jgi:cytochrome P450